MSEIRVFPAAGEPYGVRNCTEQQGFPTWGQPVSQACGNDTEASLETVTEVWSADEPIVFLPGRMSAVFNSRPTFRKFQLM